MFALIGENVSGTPWLERKVTHTVNCFPRIGVYAKMLGVIPVYFQSDRESYLTTIAFMRDKFGIKGDDAYEYMWRNSSPVGGSNDSDTLGRRKCGVIFNRQRFDYIKYSGPDKVFDESYQAVSRYTNKHKENPLFADLALFSEVIACGLAEKRVRSSVSISDQVESDLTFLYSAFGIDNNPETMQFARDMADIRALQYLITGDKRYAVAPYIDKFIETLEAMNRDEGCDLPDVKKAAEARNAAIRHFNATYKRLFKNHESRGQILKGEFVPEDAYFVDRMTEACENLIPETSEVAEVEKRVDGDSERPGLWGLRRFHIVRTLGGISRDDRRANTVYLAGEISGFAEQYLETLHREATAVTLAPLEGIALNTDGLKDFLTHAYRSSAGSDFDYNNMVRRMKDSADAKRVANAFIKQRLPVVAKQALTI